MESLGKFTDVKVDDVSDPSPRLGGLRRVTQGQGLDVWIGTRPPAFQRPADRTLPYGTCFMVVEKLEYCGGPCVRLLHADGTCWAYHSEVWDFSRNVRA